MIDFTKTALPIRLLWYISRCIYVIVTNFMYIPSYIMWLVLLHPLKTMVPEVYWAIERAMFKGLLSCVSVWVDSGGIKIHESGDCLDNIIDAKAVVLVNHQSTSDVPVVMTAFQNKGKLVPHMMWIMDYVFKFTNFGFVCRWHGDFFLQQGREFRDTQLEKLKDHLKAIYMTTHKKWVVLFPEGGFLRKRLQNSQKYAKKNGYPVLKHLTLPRLGALQAIIDTLNPPHVEQNGAGENTDQPKCRKQIEWIIDMTVAYPKAEPLDIHGVCIGWWSPRTISVHYRVYPVNSIPTHNTEEFTTWLYNKYEQKEQILEELYTNDIPMHVTDKETRCAPRMTPGIVIHDNIARVIYHIFFTMSFLLFWSYLISPGLTMCLWCLSFVF